MNWKILLNMYLQKFSNECEGIQAVRAGTALSEFMYVLKIFTCYK